MVMLDGVKTLDKDVVEREQRLVQRYLDYWRHREPVQHKEPVQPGNGGSAQHMQDNRTMLDRNRETTRKRRTEFEIVQTEADEWLAMSRKRRR